MTDVPFNFPGAENNEPLTDDELEASLKSQIEASVGFFGDRVGTERAELMSIYMRHGYTEDEERRKEDLSTTVDSSAQDSVDHILAELLRTFAGVEDAVTFLGNTEEDAEQAEQEMDAVRHIFYTQNPGYLILQHWLWDGLVTINGFVKCWLDVRKEVRLERYSDLTEDELDILIADFETDGAEVEVVSQERIALDTLVPLQLVEASRELQLEAEEAELVGGLIVDDEAQAIQFVRETIDVTLRITETKKQIKIRPVPPDEVLIASRWESLDLQDAPFVGHRFLATESDLIAQGADPDQVSELPTSEDEEFGDERTTRFDGFDLFESDDRASVDRATRNILVTECWARVDRDGDGIAELIKATLVGADAELLRDRDGKPMVEQVEEADLHAWTPFIIPHRHFGECPTQRLKDVQRNRTVGERQMMDNMVISNNAGSIVDMNKITDDTIDDALTYRAGRVVRALGTDAVQPLTLPATFQDALPVLDYWEARREERSGATKLSQGLTSDKLGKNVAGVTIAQLIEAGMNKLDMIARNFAETGYVSLFRHIHALSRRHIDRELAFPGPRRVRADRSEGLGQPVGRSDRRWPRCEFQDREGRGPREDPRKADAGYGGRRCSDGPIEDLQHAFRYGDRPRLQEFEPLLHRSSHRAAGASRGRGDGSGARDCRSRGGSRPHGRGRAPRRREAEGGQGSARRPAERPRA